MKTIFGVNDPNNRPLNSTNDPGIINFNFSQPKVELFLALDPTSSDYKFVSNLFFMPLIDPKNYQIEVVYRVQNQSLTNKFLTKQAQLGSNGRQIVNVWHGTKSFEIYKSICETGFKIGGIDVRIKHGDSYGTGVNTGDDPYVCMSYTQNCGFILLCDALPGEISYFTKQKNSQNKGNSYHAGNAFIFFEADQVCPKFLIKFHNKS